jgi:ribosomal protein S18 acetylase RimI-like enzyme
MAHLLDNPIYNALASGNENLSLGNEQAKYFLPEVDPFAGLKENSRADMDALYRISQAESFFILFMPGEVEIPDQWKIVRRMKILQMVYEKPGELRAASRELVDLNESDIPAMLDLTKMTNPGPFLSDTIRFGNYAGIFDGDRLIAMAGQRLQPKPFVEISAVCTHPAYIGKGFASMLISDQIRRITASSGIPFLHVLEDNAVAIKIYQKLGLAARRKITAYAIRKRAVQRRSIKDILKIPGNPVNEIALIIYPHKERVYRNFDTPSVRSTGYRCVLYCRLEPASPRPCAFMFLRLKRFRSILPNR